MMISTKGRYALRIMVDVAQHDGETPVSVREIAQRSGVSFRTLYAYEHGETEGGIMLDKYMAICEVIGADPVMLLAEAMAGNPEDK